MYTFVNVQIYKDVFLIALPCFLGFFHFMFPSHVFFPKYCIGVCMNGLTNQVYTTGHKVSHIAHRPKSQLILCSGCVFSNVSNCPEK